MKRAMTLVVAGVALAAVPAPALASKGQVSIFQHDALLRGSGDQVRAETLDELDRLGVDVVKVLVLWRSVAPAGKKKPSGFAAKDPAAYSSDAWAPYDSLVQMTSARGMRVFFALGGKAPDWASKGKEGVKKPSPRAFRKFTIAVGRRYSGSYVVGAGSAPPSGETPAPDPEPDPEMPLPLPLQASTAGAGATLPRVNLWSVWNEPNLHSWLSPQRRKGRPYAPHHYRRLVKGASSGLRKSGHGSDTLLLGELLPYGSSRKRTRPLAFLREFACVNKRYRPFRGKKARKRGCRHYKRLPGSGFAIHPYTLAGGPGVRMPNRDDVTISYLGRLTKALNKLGKKRRLRKRMPVWVTEFAFQTDPPDIFQTPIKKVPGFMGWSEWLSYKKGRVRSHSQYLLTDDPLEGSGFSRYGTFQTGIRFADGKKKRAVYSAYRYPFFVKQRGRRKVEVFGGVRSAGRGRKVKIQVRRGGKWRKLGRARTAKRGYFHKRLRISRAGKRAYRFRSGAAKSVKLRAR